MNAHHRAIFLVFTLLGLMGFSSAYSASDFDGSTSRVEITYSAPLGSTTMTAGCWTRREGDGEVSAGVILNKRPSGVTEDWQLVSGLTVGAYRVNIAFTDTLMAYDFTPPAQDTWAHVAFTYDGTTADPIVYVNAVVQSLTLGGSTAGTYVPGTGNVVIGDRVASDRSWDGQLAECFYYNRVLSANEMTSIACRGALCGVRSVPRGLIAYWPLGVFGGRNYTSTPSLNGTATGVTVLNNGPPIAYSSQGGPP